MVKRGFEKFDGEIPDKTAAFYECVMTKLSSNLTEFTDRKAALDIGKEEFNFNKIEV